ncbi:SGNH/GDSL hydrolase family protein [Nocardioides sp. 503]|uniref:SGNH/GDSL hydrolase family protein n=1 Tax=Nocardioides sp. 503 TaxID=2508326 RepID=UPI001432194E|nr:SGNH/GDSL hydrolase family protein [Nocardioides sp. 503]
MVLRGVAARKPLVLTLLAALLATVVLTFQLTDDAEGAFARRCERFAEASSWRAQHDNQHDGDDGDDGSGDRVVVIGDSYSAGLRLDRPQESWPARLPGHVHVDGFSGSGFSARASGCGPVSFADRAHRALADGADLVVVEGGLNDYDRTAAEITAGFLRLVRAVGDVPMLVVGPPPAPLRGRHVARVDEILRDLAARHDATYLSMADVDLRYLDDGLHLTAGGHEEFGDLVAASVVQVVQVEVADRR